MMITDEGMRTASQRMEAAAESASAAADRMEAAVHRLALLLEDSYGGNGLRLIEALEKAQAPTGWLKETSPSPDSDYKALEERLIAKIAAFLNGQEKSPSLRSDAALHWDSGTPTSTAQAIQTCIGLVNNNVERGYIHCSLPTETLALVVAAAKKSDSGDVHHY